MIVSLVNATVTLLVLLYNVIGFYGTFTALFAVPSLCRSSGDHPGLLSRDIIGCMAIAAGVLVSLSLSFVTIKLGSVRIKGLWDRLALGSLTGVGAMLAVLAVSPLHAQIATYITARAISSKSDTVTWSAIYQHAQRAISTWFTAGALLALAWALWMLMILWVSDRRFYGWP